MGMMTKQGYEKLLNEKKKLEKELDLSNGVISYTSPIGMSLLNKVEGDEFETKLPSGSVKIRIVKILG